MLHIVKTPQALLRAFSYIHLTDSIILIEDSVYCANGRHELYSNLSGFNVFVLQEDVVARGMVSLMSEHVKQVDYSGFVDLTVKHSTSMTWD